MNEHLSERPNTTPHISMTAREPGSSNRDLEKKWVPAGSNSSVYNPSLPKSNREWLAPYRGNHGKHTCRSRCSQKPWHGMNREVVNTADRHIRPGTAHEEHPAHDPKHAAVPLALGKVHVPSRVMQREFIKAIKTRMDGERDDMISGVLPPRLPHMSSLAKHEPILRPHFSLIWQREPPKAVSVKEYKPKKAFYSKKLTDNEFEAEIDSVSTAVGTEIPRDQIALLYKAFRRQTEDSQFTREEWVAMMEKIGLNREEVANRIFDTWAKGQVYARTLSYKAAVFALCALGVGSRAMQAEAVFRSCDKNGNKEVSRGEMLAFVTDQNPYGKFAAKKSKTEAFAHVGKLFDLMKVSGKSEITMQQFIAVVAEEDQVFYAFQKINPYRKYFLTKGQSWDTNDFSLQNVLNALFLHADAAESAAALADRVEALGKKIDDDSSGFLDNQEILDALIALGYDQEDAQQLAEKECGPKGMAMETFVMVFTEIAQVNLMQFEAVEKKYGVKDREQQHS